MQSRRCLARAGAYKFAHLPTARIAGGGVRAVGRIFIHPVSHVRMTRRVRLSVQPSRTTWSNPQESSAAAAAAGAGV